MNKPSRMIRGLVGAALAAGVLVALPNQASAAVTDSVPDQTQCDAPGSNGLIGWPDVTGAPARPVVASMTVEGEVVPDPAHPADHGLGIAICSNMPDARKVGLTVIHKEGSNLMSDVSGAKTPVSNQTINEGSDIKITLTNMGDLAKYFSFALVHGNVTQWTPTNLGTANASLTVSLQPRRTPLIDTQANPADGFCSATPPNCNAVKSGLDVVSASMDMDFDQNGSFADFRGAYFGLEGAVAGFVQAARSNGAPAVRATLGGPHFLANGTTLNRGSMQAFLPDAVVANVFGIAADTKAVLGVTRTEGTTTSEANFDVSAVTGGIQVRINDIGFSSPVYNITAMADASGPQSGGSGGLPDPKSYRLFAADGGVFNYGASSKPLGSAASLKLNSPIVGGASAYAGSGYWMVAADGGVFSYGDAKFAGSAGALKLNSPIVGMAANPFGTGYWLVAADGGVFAYGEAKFRGSAGALKLNSPIVGITPTLDGDGYWLVAADGGVFAYGDAKFKGSAGNIKLKSPIVGATFDAYSGGYWLAAADGGVFAYGGAKFHGSAGALTLKSPVVGVRVSENGYTLVAADGGVFAYGDAKFAGSPSNLKLAKPIVGIG